MPFSEEERKIFSVSEITSRIKQTLEVYFTAVWVEGEISNLRRPSSGHLYFTLKDEKAELKAVMFRFVNKKLKFKLENGLQVLIYGGVTVYEKRGEYQISAVEVEPKGLGALQLAFEQLKKRLEKEGLFSPVHKKSIPLLPRKIGIITSATGAAIRDIIHLIDRRYANVQLLLNPVRVQGEGAAEEIARAIGELNEIGGIDVIILGRGGGSVEDLWAFNEEIVARSIFDSDIPIISAVGHEIDYTISDFTADLRAATPSHAAELVVGRREELENCLAQFVLRLKSAVKNKFESLKNRLQRAQQSYAFRIPLGLIEQYGQRIDDLTERIKVILGQRLEILKGKLGAFSGRLEALSPLGVLSRGYSLALKLPERKSIRNVKTLKINDSVEVIVHRGKFTSKVTEIQRTEDREQKTENRRQSFSDF